MKFEYGLAGVMAFLMLSITGLIAIAPNEEINPTSPDIPVTGHISLVDNLRAQGTNVEPADEISQPFFSVVGNSVLINGENVQVFEYSSAEDAEFEASFVSSDASEIGTSMPLWVGTPHFYLKERIIVLYVGDDTATKELLESILGNQFAGR